jgi:hypothetical protein
MLHLEVPMSACLPNVGRPKSQQRSWPVTRPRGRESRRPERTLRPACRERTRCLMARSACPTVALGTGWQLPWRCGPRSSRRVPRGTLRASRKSASRRRPRAAWACPQVRTSEVHGIRTDLVANRYARRPWCVVSSSPRQPAQGVSGPCDRATTKGATGC